MVDELIKADIGVVRKLHQLLENLGIEDTEEVLKLAKEDLRNRNL